MIHAPDPRAPPGGIHSQQAPHTALDTTSSCQDRTWGGAGNHAPSGSDRRHRFPTKPPRLQHESKTTASLQNASQQGTPRFTASTRLHHSCEIGRATNPHPRATQLHLACPARQVPKTAAPRRAKTSTTQPGNSTSPRAGPSSTTKNTAQRQAGAPRARLKDATPPRGRALRRDTKTRLHAEGRAARGIEDPASPEEKGLGDAAANRRLAATVCACEAAQRRGFAAGERLVGAAAGRRVVTTLAPAEQLKNAVSPRVGAFGGGAETSLRCGVRACDARVNQRLRRWFTRAWLRRDVVAGDDFGVERSWRRRTPLARAEERAFGAGGSGRLVQHPEQTGPTAPGSGSGSRRKGRGMLGARTSLEQR